MKNILISLVGFGLALSAGHAQPSRGNPPTNMENEIWEVSVKRGH